MPAARVLAAVWEVTQDSRLRAGGKSGLALLAGDVRARFLLLDPRDGCVGLHTQLIEAIDYFATSRVILVDVGGDVGARGDEPTLSSPLADGLALAATAGLPVPTTIAIAGPGLDGELPAAYVRQRLTSLGATQHQLSDTDVTDYTIALDHHPSEATTLLVASTLGVQGRAEIRDSAALISLDRSSSTVFMIDHGILFDRSDIAKRLISTLSLAEAEDITIQTCGRTELTHERSKAAALAAQNQPATVDLPELQRRYHRYREQARIMTSVS